VLFYSPEYCCLEQASRLPLDIKTIQDAIEKVKKPGKFTPLVDDHSIQASGMFSTLADDNYCDGNPAPKPAGKKWRVGPMLEDPDEDDLI